MKQNWGIGLALSLVGTVLGTLLTVAMFFTAGWTRPPIQGTQIGFRGTAQDLIKSKSEIELLRVAHTLPPSQEKASPDGERATQAYQNVQVLTDLSADQFNRVMLSITEWVSPEQGCAYCHNVENLAEDKLYTKIVARKMLQMTRAINTSWKQHVADTGVTCYTCHRGQPVPREIWFKDDGGPRAGGFTPDNYGMGHPSKANGSTAMLVDPFSPYVKGNEPIRVAGSTALPKGKGASIMATENTYSLMMHMSSGLGVNCNFCHNSRNFADWKQSTPQRATAFHGLSMVRELNNTWIDPLKPVFPANRLGPKGDVAGINCATCHNGASKPFLGVSHAKDFPELGGVAK